MSVISWLDASADEQRRVTEIVRLFSQRDTQDTMGGRRIVVALSDALFPGTSVLHTRARYLLFVPWLCQRAVKSNDPLRRLDRLERELIESFKADTTVPDDDRVRGLIGRAAGAAVKQLPSVAYWTAFSSWGILEWPGSPKNTLDRMSSLPGLQRIDGADELADRAPRVWHPGVGTFPAGFPGDDIDGGFRLKPDEARWLSERWRHTADGSMLVDLVSAGEPLSSSSPWEHPPSWNSTPNNTALLEHAEWFALAIAGAQALYSLLVAERYVELGFNRVDVDLDWHRHVVVDWEDEVAAARGRIATWDPDSFWATLSARGTAIDPHTRAFFSVWFDVTRTGGTSIADDASLRDTVGNREVRLKTAAQSRLVNDALLASWGGGVPSRTDFRWTSVSTLVNDVLTGLDGDGDDDVGP